MIYVDSNVMIKKMKINKNKENYIFEVPNKKPLMSQRNCRHQS